MKRGSNGEAFLRLVERMRKTIPGVMLRTSFIVGFPGETAADFRELSDFVKAAEFDWMGVFAYSDVDNVASHGLDKKVDEETIAERRGHLMSMQRKISARRLKRFVGQRLPVLVEGPSKETELVWEGRLQGMAPEIDGKVYLNDLDPPSGGRAARPGDIATVEISESHEYDLVGHVVEIQDALPVVRPLAASPAMSPVQRISTGAALRVLA
jgi:ribosomal protein S12 methylthiotransferase